MMNEELKLRSAALRWTFEHDDCTCLNDVCPAYEKCYQYDTTLCDEREAADLIESLTAQLEQATMERDGLNIMLCQAQSMLETRTRERDAAVEDMRRATLVGCHVCKHYYRPDPEVRKYACRVHGSFEEHDFISDDGSVFCGAFKWRGVQEVER